MASISLGEITLIGSAMAGLGAGITAGINAWSSRKTPTRTVAVTEIEAALEVLGKTIDRMESELTRLEGENKTLRGENHQLRASVNALRFEVDRLQRLIEDSGDDPKGHHL